MKAAWIAESFRRTFRPWMLYLLSVVFIVNGVPVLLLGHPRLYSIPIGLGELSVAYLGKVQVTL